MKKEIIAELFAKFENARIQVAEIECWSAREIQNIFNYTEWRNFLKVVEKAKISCSTSNHQVSDHFVDINKMINLAKGAQRKIQDLALTRYACYLTAQT